VSRCLATTKFNKGPLKSGYHYGDLVEEVDAKKPPAGTYKLTFSLGEMQEEKYVIRDAISFDKTRS